MTDSKIQAAINVLNQCALACHHCSTACLDEPNPGEMLRCIKLDLDCAAMCEVTSAALARGSERAGWFANACAELCKACGQECEKHQAGHCQQCAEACFGAVSPLKELVVS